MKFAIHIKSGGWWRNFETGDIRSFDSRRVAQQVINNWMIDGEVVEWSLDLTANQGADISEDNVPTTHL